MKSITTETFICEIYLAGNMADIERVCAQYVMEVGACVSVEPVKYIYTGGREDGAVVRFVNYPRFPSDPQTLHAKAKTLALLLMDTCCQWSALIVDPDFTEWLTKRPEDNK